MLASIAVRVAACALAGTVRPASGPRRPANAINDALAALTTRVDGVDPSVVRELRGVSRCVTRRLGIWRAREALQRLEEAHPDAPGHDGDREDQPARQA
jgi:hypothetical protein